MIFRTKPRLLLAGLLLCRLFFATTSGATTIDSSSRVFLIVMENHNWSTILGSASAPYINNTLLPQSSYCDQYYNPPAIHPSLPNYLWLEAGTGFGIANDSPPSVNHQSTTNHLARRLSDAGISWKTYQENMVAGTCPTTDSYPYYVKHNPFAYFDDVVASGCTSVMRPFTEFAADLANQNVAHYNFITPNICNDMHDSCAPTNNSIRQGDNWLAAVVPGILSSAAYQNNGLLIITWDEGGGGSDGPIGMIVLSPLAKGGGYHNALHYTHSSTLRTLQKIFGLVPDLGGAATALDLSDLFLPGAIPNADPQVVIREVAHSGTGTIVRWTSQPGITYRVQWKNTLVETVWQTITPDLAGTGSILSWTDNGSQTGGLGATQRFYRVIVP